MASGWVDECVTTPTPNVTVPLITGQAAPKTEQNQHLFVTLIISFAHETIGKFDYNFLAGSPAYFGFIHINAIPALKGTPTTAI